MSALSSRKVDIAMNLMLEVLTKKAAAEQWPADVLANKIAVLKKSASLLVGTSGLCDIKESDFRRDLAARVGITPAKALLINSEIQAKNKGPRFHQIVANGLAASEQVNQTINDACSSCGVTKLQVAEEVEKNNLLPESQKLKLVRALQKCARCQTAIYCSKGCQTTHWPVHKHTCKKISPRP